MSSAMHSAMDLQRQVALARTEIKNLRQQISALKHEHLKEIGHLKSMLENIGTNGPINPASAGPPPVPPSPGATPQPASHITYRPIGHLETGFRSKRAVPRQPSASGECRGTLVLHSDVYNNPEHALDGLTEFSHMWIVFHMHATEGGGTAAKVRPPRLRGERRGVLATRSPHRPCPVGLSLVRILGVDGEDRVPHARDGGRRYGGEGAPAAAAGRAPRRAGDPLAAPALPRGALARPHTGRRRIVFHMHATEGGGTAAKVRPPRLRGERRGVLATRSPHRPCPVGLSLVRILGVDGNRIEFSGVDMLSGTAVLDIKPYIPQYDYPAGLRRPPAEGDDEPPSVAAIDVDDGSGLSPRLTRPIAIDTDSPILPSRSSNFSDDELDSPARSDLQGSALATPVSPADSPPSGATDRTPRARRPPTERGAPDGQERFTPPQSSLTHDGIRVPSWVTNPPSQPLEVRFSEDVVARLNGMIGDRADVFKANLESLLSEDPRSHYVRTRYPDHEYSCVLEDVSISCVFDDSASTCTVIAIRNAEDMQQT